MHSANRFPVLVYDRDAREAYKSGGLAAKARDVADAGRFDDTHIIHVTDDELEMLRQQWGDPTINPHTGMPEFGIFGSIFKVLKKIAPIAVSFIPGIGPIASAALGAGLGALDGGGLKGALLGGVTGALGAGGAGGIGAKLGTNIGGKVLGNAASAAAKNALGQAAIQGTLGAIAGRDPLSSALGGALQGYFQAPRTAGAPTTTTAPTTAAPTLAATPTAAPATMAANPVYTPPSISSPAKFDFGVDAATQAMIDKAASGTLAPTTTAQPNFWNKDFLGLGIAKNKYAIPAVIGAAALADAAKPKTDTSMPSQEAFFGPSFSQSSLKAPGNFKLASVLSGTSPESAAAEYAKKYFTGFAVGGDVGGEGHSRHNSFAVQGPGTGRSDEIPAMLSDGEYVVDAETVALLGDGSPKAGAKRLDDLRVKIRKHKGRKLAKGKFSPDAKPAEKYMAGGRI